MKVVFINDSPHWNAQSEYGVALARKLSERAHRVLYLGKREGHSMPMAEGLGLETIPLSCTGVSFLSDVRALRQTLRDHVDIVNALGPWGQNIAIAALGRKSRSHLVRTRVFIHPVRGGLFQRRVYHTYVGLVVVSNESSRKETISRLHFPEAKVRCIHGGIDLRHFHPGVSGASLRERLGVGSAPLVGVIARRSPIKGHRYFLEAAAIVKARHPEVRFLVVGPDDCVSLEELIALADASGVRRETIFLGFYPDIQKVMSALDIGVISSIGSEEHCRVGLEMMGMAKPMVGTRVGAVPEIIREGITGYLAEPKDAHGLAEGILALLSDRDRARNMGLAARRIVQENFSLDLCAEKTERAFMSLRN